MSSVSIAGDTSGSILLAAPAVAGSSTVTLPTTGGTVLTTASTGVCVAWVTINGSSGQASIRAGYNVTSVTYRADGRYTINFTNALADSNYCVIGMVSNDSTGTSGIIATQDYSFAAPTTTSCAVMTGYPTGSGMVASALYRPTNYAYFAFFR
jgi:hypothetical protein